jgi:hypothetical protein
VRGREGREEQTMHHEQGRAGLQWSSFSSGESAGLNQIAADCEDSNDFGGQQFPEEMQTQFSSAPYPSNENELVATLYLSEITYELWIGRNS